MLHAALRLPLLLLVLRVTAFLQRFFFARVFVDYDARCPRARLRPNSEAIK